MPFSLGYFGKQRGAMCMACLVLAIGPGKPLSRDNKTAWLGDKPL